MVNYKFGSPKRSGGGDKWFGESIFLRTIFIFHYFPHEQNQEPLNAKNEEWI